jgi:hypothetical protein
VLEDLENRQPEPSSPLVFHRSRFGRLHTG